MTAAYEAGRIDRATALVYRLAASVGDDRLPAEFRATSAWPFFSGRSRVTTPRDFERCRPDLDPERLARAESLAMAAAPDRDAGPTVDLPRTVATDHSGTLIDPQDRATARRLQRDEGGERFRPGIVVRHDGESWGKPKTRPPAQRPRRDAGPELEGIAGHDHRPSRAARQDRSSLVR